MHIEQNYKRYFLSTVTIKDYNVMIDDRRTYGNLRKITTGQVDDYTTYSKSSYPKVLLVKDVLKICSKFTGKHPCRSGISIKLQGKFIEITLWHGCSPVNLLQIFRTLFSKNTSEWLLLPCSTVLCLFPNLL